MTIHAWLVLEFTRIVHRLVIGLSLALLTWATPGATQSVSPPPSTVAAHGNVAAHGPMRLPQGFASGPRSQSILPPNPNATALVGRQQLGAQQLPCTPPPAPNEIVELARALKWSPDLIYEYVHDNIGTTPIYDSLKGPLGTLLDGVGTPVDQAELTYALLQQSCFSPQYQVGMIFLSADQLDEWLGTATSGNPNQFYSIAKILIDGGFCTSFTTLCDGLQFYTTDGTVIGPVVGADVPWIWVSVPINGTTYQFEPASKTFPFLGGDGYFPYSSGLGGSLVAALKYDQSVFLQSARAGASGIGTPALNFAPTGLANVRNSLTQYVNNLVAYIRGPSGPGAATTTTDIIGGATIQPLYSYTPSGDTFWGQTGLFYLNAQGIPPTTTASLGAFRTTLTLTLGWNDQSNNFTQLANPITFNSGDIYGHRLVIQFNASNVAGLLLDGVTAATASGAVPSNNPLTARVAILHPHIPCASLPLPTSCGGPGPNIDNIRVMPAPAGGSIFVVGNGWGGSNRGLIERHRKLLQQNLIQGLSATSEAVLGESLAMIGSTWLAANTRGQFLTGQLTGTTVNYFHAVGIVGMKPVGSSQGPYIDLPLNTIGALQRVSRPSFSSAFTPVESSAFFTTVTFSSALESGAIEQTQPKDVNGQIAVAASTIKLLDVWSTAGTIYDLNDSTISGDGCAYYNTSVKNNLVNFTPADRARVEALIGYSASTNTCSTPPSTTQVIVPSNGQIGIGLWNGTGYLEVVNNQDNTDIIGIGAIITGGLSGGEPGSPIPPDNVNQNQASGAPQVPISGCDDCNTGSPSQIGNGNASALNNNPAVANGGSSGTQASGGDPINLVTGAYTYSHHDMTVGSGKYPYALPFVRSYDSALGQVGANSSALGRGWMHNYDMTAFTDSDGFETMGENSPISGAAGIAAIYVIQDILNLQTSNAKPVDRLVVAAQIERWLLDQSTGNMVSVTQPGSIERFTLLPNSGGSNVYVPPLGSSSQLTALAGGGYCYRLKTGEIFTFNPSSAVASGRATSWSSPSGTTVTFSYNSDGQLQSVSSAATQQQLNLHYTNHQLTSVDDNIAGSARTVSYSYDSHSNLVAVTDPLQQTTGFNYGAIGQLTQIFYPSNPGNPFITTVYDSLGRASRQSDAVGNTTSLFFAGARSETDDPAATARVSYFSSHGKTLTSIEGWGSSGINSGAGIKTINQYDGLDRLVATFLPEGGAITYAYATDINPWANNISQIIQLPKPVFSDAASTTLVYDPIYNKPTSVTDSLGLVNTMDYDPATGNLRSTTNDAGLGHFNATSRFTYNSFGQPVTATDPLGSVTQFGYDVFGNQTSVVRDAGVGRLNQLTSFGYNARGDVVSITDPKGNITTNTYDAARHLTGTTAANGTVTSYNYDPNGQVIQVQQSANGTILRSTGVTYTLTGKPATTTDANNNMTRLSYDFLDRVSSVTDAMSRTTSYGYDALGRQVSISNLAIQSAPLLRKSYTLDGLLASLTDAKNFTTSFSYDGIDRRVTTTYAPGSTETLTYDADSNVLTRKTRANQTISFTYDTLNRMKTKTPPSPGTAVNYSYDLNNRLTGVSDGSAAIPAAIPPSGPSVQYAMNYSYDAVNRPTAVAWIPASSAAVPSLSGVTFNHTYNKTNQRIGQTVTDNSWINYPAATPATVSYTADVLNRYTAVGAVDPTYDDNSNLTFDGTFSFGYDAENRLISASGAGNTATYTFDAQGRRKSKTVNGATTVFVTDADNREVLEYDGASGAIQRWYAYGPGSNDVLNRTDVAAGTRAALIPDIQGSVIASLDSGSGALSKIGYLPYGKGAGAGPFGYTAQRIDPETNGLYYYRARHYSPAWGRFLQADPVGYSGGVNVYAYVNNDPLNLLDPFGLSPDSPSPTAASTLALPGVGTAGGTIATAGAGTIAATLGLAGAALLATTTSTAGPEQDEVQYVVRGGAGAASSFQQGTNLTSNGYGFSVQTAPSVSINELARGGYFPNAQISVSTVQELQAIPGVTVNSPTPGFGDYHGTVNVPNPPPVGFFNVISGAFVPQPNPFQVPR